MSDTKKVFVTAKVTKQMTISFTPLKFTQVCLRQMSWEDIKQKAFDNGIKWEVLDAFDWDDEMWNAFVKRAVDGDIDLGHLYNIEDEGELLDELLETVIEDLMDEMIDKMKKIQG